MKKNRKAAPQPAPAHQPVPLPETAPSNAPQQDGTHLTRWQTVGVFCLPLLLLFAMTVQTGTAALLLAALALALSIGKTPLQNLKQRLSLPVWGFLAFLLLCGCAGIYSSFGDYAATELYQLLASGSIGLVVLLRVKKSQVPALLWGFSAVCALVSLLCIDLGGSGSFSSAYTALMGGLGVDISTIVGGITTSSQLGGIFNNANLTGGILALGMLVTIYLLHSATARWRQMAAALLLGICALGFFLSMSRGAILCFGVSLLVYLLLSDKGERLALFFLLVIAAAATLALSLVAAPLLLKGSTLPVLLAFLNGALIFLLYICGGRPLARKLCDHGKAVAVTIAAVLLALGAYFVAAVALTSSAEIGALGVFSRTISLPAGEYTLSGDWDEGIRVNIDSFTRQEILMGTSTRLYTSELGDEGFTVVEGVAQVSLYFYGDPGMEIRQVSLSDGTALRLGYPLLPTFLVERMQGGLFQSSAYLLRMQMIKDGWTLFTQSPLLGHGMGSTEGLLTSVQPFFYESLYIHNHLIQILDETGLLGAAAFLCLMLGAAWLLLRQLRRQRGALPAMLLACLVMMNLHGLMEITFSVRPYQCAAYFLLVLVAVLYARPTQGKGGKMSVWIAATAIWAFLAVFGGLLGSHRLAQRDIARFETDNVVEFLEACKRFVRRDVFDHEQSQLSFVGNAVLLPGNGYRDTLEDYVEELRRSGTFPACTGLARYYYLPLGNLAEMFAVSREGIAQEASTNEAWNLQLDFYRNEVLAAISAEQTPDFIAGVLATRDALADYSVGRLEEISLSEENQIFLQRVDTASSLDANGAYLLLRTTA